MKSAPKLEDYADIREFLRDWETYWDQTKPTGRAILERAARLANDAAVAVEMQLGRIREGLRSGDPDAFWKVLIDVEFLIASLWKMRLAGKLAQPVMGQKWSALREFDTAVPDLKLMRDVMQHVDEYGRDDAGRHDKRVGRRSLHTMQFGERSFSWLGGTIDFDRARAASVELRSAIRAARDQAGQSGKGRLCDTPTATTGFASADPPP
jgi:hypothetical protein